MRLHNCYLFSVDDMEKAQSEVESFAREFLAVDNLTGCSDFLLIQKLDNKVKNISVDQVRAMQDFLYKSSVLSGKKIAVMVSCDKMNINSANSCLKILEDTPLDTYIFLLAENGLSLPETLRSRCIELHCNDQKSGMPLIDEQIIQILLNDNVNVEAKHNFIEQFASKDRMLWKKFAHDIEFLIVKLTYHQHGLHKCELSDLEHKLFTQIGSSAGALHQKYEDAIKIITQTESYDLELRVSVILLIELFAK